MPFCPNCGVQSEPEAAFCGACGTRIEGAAPSSPPTAGPPARGEGRRWLVIGAIGLLVAVIVAGVVLWSAVTDDGEGRESVIGADGGQEATPTAQSPAPEATTPPTEPPVPTLTSEPPPTEEATLEPVVQGFVMPEDAIFDYLGQLGLGYVGDCVLADLETDIGFYCSQVWEDQFDTRIYLVGLTFSEADTWLLLSRLGARDDWTVLDFAPVGPLEEELVPPWP